MTTLPPETRELRDYRRLRLVLREGLVGALDSDAADAWDGDTEMGMNIRRWEDLMIFMGMIHPWMGSFGLVFPPKKNLKKTRWSKMEALERWTFCHLAETFLSV